MKRTQILFSSWCLMATCFASTDLKSEVTSSRDQWYDAATLMQSHARADTPGENRKIGIMYAALTIDLIWLAIRMIANFKGEEVGFGCDFLFTLLWYPLTVYTLGGVFPGTDLSQGVDMATQQITSIGYGGANVRGNDQKLFHAVNGMASQMGPSNVAGWLVDFFVDWVIAGLPSILYNIEEEKLRRVFINGKPRQEALDVVERWGAQYEAMENNKDPKDKNKKEPKLDLYPDDSIPDKPLLLWDPSGKETIEKVLKNREDSAVIKYINEKFAYEKEQKWKQMFKGIILLVFGALTFWLLYNPTEKVSEWKNGEPVVEKSHGDLQAFYATLISATTVGYGDISPSSNWAKQLSAFVLPVLTAVFGDFFGTTLDGGSNKEFKELECPDLDGLKDKFIAKTKKNVMAAGAAKWGAFKDAKQGSDEFEAKQAALKIAKSEKEKLAKDKEMLEAEAKQEQDAKQELERQQG